MARLLDAGGYLPTSAEGVALACVARALGLRVRWADGMPYSAAGVWEPATGCIWLNRYANIPVTPEKALAHELAHVLGPDHRDYEQQRGQFECYAHSAASMALGHTPWDEWYISGWIMRATDFDAREMDRMMAVAGIVADHLEAAVLTQRLLEEASE